jgi:phosphatidylglycerol:prolipoprotein diacylglycerol transferase
MDLAVITIRLDPEIHLGPLTLAWHGLTIAIGILIGSLAAARWLRERELSVEPLYTIGALIVVGAIVGGRILYLLEHDASALWTPGRLLGTTGFTFDGGVILAALLILAYVRRAGLSRLYLDAVAAGLPLGVAVGRVGDVINGEHYGPRSDFILAVRNANPDALTPNPGLAYHSGGLYEVLLAALIFCVIWPLRHRFRTAGVLAWTVIGLFAAGRFFEFFLRSDSPDLALGLDNAQWTSIALMIASAIGLVFTLRGARAGRRA